MSRDPECKIGRHQGQRNLDARLMRPFPQMQAQPSNREPVKGLADNDENECLRCAFERECSGADGDDGEAVKHQRGSVVGEAFAFQHNDNPARQSKFTSDRERRHDVGRRNDCAKKKADGPVELQKIISGCRYRAGGKQDAAESQQCNWPQVELEFTPAHGDAGGINQRRQYHQQYDFRREFDLGKTLGTNATPIPATTSRIDGAIFRRLATTATAASTASMNSSVSTVAVIVSRTYKLHQIRFEMMLTVKAITETLKRMPARRAQSRCGGSLCW